MLNKISNLKEQAIMKSKEDISLSDLAKSIKIDSLYEHYKGNKYKVLAVAKHSETLEEYIVYQALYGNFLIWIRPLSMFLENVNIDGQIKPRFKLIE